MIVIIRGRSTRKTQVPTSKVKVALRGQRSKIGTKCPSGVISTKPFSRFSNNYTQIIVTIRGRSTRKTQVPTSKVKVTLRGQRSKMETKCPSTVISTKPFGTFSNNYTQLFCAHKTQVILRGQRSKLGTKYLSGVISKEPFCGFSLYFV